MNKIKKIVCDVAHIVASAYTFAMLAFMSASTAWALPIVQRSPTFPVAGYANFSLLILIIIGCGFVVE